MGHVMMVRDAFACKAQEQDKRGGEVYSKPKQEEGTSKECVEEEECVRRRRSVFTRRRRRLSKECDCRYHWLQGRNLTYV
jgi:hypothetical protein